MSKTFTVRILRRPTPHGPSEWESFRVPLEHGMNVTTVLQRIAANPVTTDRKPTTPVAYDANCLEEVCGACSMLINGHVRQACSALVDQLLHESPDGIELRPMSKFPVIRDLFVDRRSMFDGLKKVRAWVPVGGYYDIGPGPRIAPRQQEEAYALARCMTCGCCLEACPQYNDRSPFIGPAAIAQAVLFNAHPVAAVEKDERLDALSGPGGVVDCGNSQNCVKVCPKDIPLTEAIAKAGRDTTLYRIRKWFGR